MARLQVNVDYVATVREARRVSYPDPVVAAAMAELAGADGITAHLRGDRRHIKERDLELLRQTVQTRLNIEMAATQEMIKIAQQIKPHQVTLVPERPDELTTEGGIDVIRHRDSLQKAVNVLKESDIQVSLFIDPDVEQVKAAHKLDVDTVELNTGRYCDAKFQVDRFHAFNALTNAAKAASKLKLVVAAGHGLNYHNIKDLHGLSEIDEYNIGFSIVSRAVLVGLDRAVREMIALVK